MCLCFVKVLIWFSKWKSKTSGKTGNVLAVKLVKTESVVSAINAG